MGLLRKAPKAPVSSAYGEHRAGAGAASRHVMVSNGLERGLKITKGSSDRTSGLSGESSQRSF